MVVNESMYQLGSGAYHSKGNRMTIWKNTMH